MTHIKESSIGDKHFVSFAKETLVRQFKIVGLIHSIKNARAAKVMAATHKMSALFGAFAARPKLNVKVMHTQKIAIGIDPNLYGISEFSHLSRQSRDKILLIDIVLETQFFVAATVTEKVTIAS